MDPFYVVSPSLTPNDTGEECDVLRCGRNALKKMEQKDIVGYRFLKNGLFVDERVTVLGLAYLPLSSFTIP